MVRCAPSAIAFLFAAMLAPGPAQADRGFDGHPGFRDGFHGGFPARRFDHRFFHRRFFERRFDHRRFFFRPFFFSGRTVFAPVPFAAFPPVPVPSYLVAPTLGPSSCYQYQTTIIIAGQPQPAFGTACLQPDGTWRIVP